MGSQINPLLYHSTSDSSPLALCLSCSFNQQEKTMKNSKLPPMYTAADANTNSEILNLTKKCVGFALASRIDHGDKAGPSLGGISTATDIKFKATVTPTEHSRCKKFRKRIPITQDGEIRHRLILWTVLCDRKFCVDSINPKNQSIASCSCCSQAIELSDIDCKEHN